MGGKLKKRRESSAKGGAILRPASSGWQKWAEDESGAWSLQREAPELADLAPAPGSLIAVPVRRAFSLAVWVPADDPGIFGDLVHTQLEMRGLAGRTRADTCFTFREIAREDSEVLLHVVVLPVHLASRYWHGEVTDYAVSPDCLPLSPDAVTIWREEGAWVAAVMRGTQLLHFQALVEPQPDAAMALEVWMMLAPLEAGNMMAEQPSVVFYLPPGEEPDLSAWARAENPRVTSVGFPAPVRPPKSLDCLPLPVRDLQARKTQSARRQRFAFAGAAVYLALVLLLAGQTLWLHWQGRRLQAEIDRQAPAVAATNVAMKRWQAMLPALEPATYPLEVLYQTARLLPKDGVRLTQFNMDADDLVIQGEASTLAAALKFEDDIKKNTDLTDVFDWEAESPKQLPNGSSRFQINGKRRAAATAQNDESTDS